MSRILIPNFPFPPSVNDAYRPNRRGSGRGLAPTRALELYESAVYDWRMENLPLVRKTMDWIQAEILAHPGTIIRLSRFYLVARDRILTKDGRPQRIDTTNYIKALDDGLGKVLQVDDRYFKAGLEEMAEAEDDSPQCVLLILEPMIPRTKAAILLSMGDGSSSIGR